MPQRFNGLLDRFLPQDDMGGLLTPGDAARAQRQAQMAFGGGLLQAASPSRLPISLGGAIGAAMPQGQAMQSERQIEALRNQQMRAQIVQQKKQQEAQEKLMGLLGGSENPEAQLMGLLGQAAPEAMMTSMAQGMFGQQKTESDPADARMMRAIGLPLTPEGFAKFQGMKNDDSTKPAMDALALSIQGLQLANMKRTADTEEQQAREIKLTRQNSIKHGLEQTKKIADLVLELEGTALASGLPASEWRRSGMGGLAAVGGALGLDMGKLNSDLTAFDTYKKNLNDQLIALMSSGSLGQGTDSKLAQYRASLASPDVQPGAVMAIQANIAQTFLDQADVLGFEVPNRSEYESSIEKMRTYQAPGSEAIVDVPAAADAAGRAVMRAADVARMSIEQLRNVDPSKMSNEALKAAAKRWAELNGR
jgi:hypothetical protein